MVTDFLKSTQKRRVMDGPYKVIRRNTGGAYILADSTTGDLLPRNYAPIHLKSCGPNPVDLSSQDSVDHILNHRRVGRKCEYLVKFSHQDEPQWIPQNLVHNQDSIKFYHSRRNETDSITSTSQFLDGGDVIPE